MLRRLYDAAYYHFMLLCLWDDQSRAYYIQCVESHKECTLSGLAATGASKKAILDMKLALPRMALIMLALLFFDIVYFMR